MSKQLRDSAFRLFSKIADDIENKRFNKAFEGLDKAEMIVNKIKTPDILFHVFFLRGLAEIEKGEPESALESYIPALEIIGKLFPEEPEKKEYQSFIDNTAVGIGKALIDLDDEEKATKYIEAVRPHIERALQAFEKLVKSEPKNPDYLSRYLEVIDDTEFCYQAWGMINEIILLFEIKLDIYEKLFETGTWDSKYLEKLDEDIDSIGLLCLSQENIELAEQIYNRGIRIYKNIVKNDPESRIAAFFLSYTYGYLGNMYSALENLEKAEHYYIEGIELLKIRIETYPEESPYLVALASMYQDLGHVFSDSEETEKAEQYYTEARKIYQELMDRFSKEDEKKEVLVRKLNELGSMFEEIEDFSDAELCYKDVLQIYEGLHETNPKKLDYLLKISEVLYQLGDLYSELGEIEQAREYYNEVVEIYDDYLEENPDEINFRAYRAEVLIEIGKLYTDEDVDTAKEYFKEARQVFENALELEPENNFFREGLFEVLRATGELYRAQNDYEKAIEQYDRIKAVLLKMIESEPETWKFNVELASNSFRLAVIYSEKGDEDRAAEYHTLALEKYKTTFSKNLGSPTSLQLFAYEFETIGINRMCRISHEVKDPETLYQYYNLARSVYEKMYDMDPECEECQALLARIVEELGNLDMDMNRFERSRDEFEYLVSLHEKIQDSDPGNLVCQLKLGNLLNNLGITYSFLQDPDKSKQTLEKAISLNEKLLESEPESLEYQEQAAATFENYSNVLVEMGKTEEAEKYQAKAEEINAKLEENKEEL